jgi:hypothetical protein
MGASAAPRNMLLTVGAVCLGASFLPLWSTIKTSPPTVEQHIFTIGVPSDPWFRHVNERRENADQTVTYSTSSEYQVGIPSALAAAAGVVLLVIGWRSRRASPAQTDATSTPSN